MSATTTRTTSTERASSRRRFAALARDEVGVGIALVALVVGVGIAHSDFLRIGNLLSNAQNATYVGLMAIGMVFPLAMREVDLSVGGVFSMGVVVGAVLMSNGWNSTLALIAVVVLGGLLGTCNGLITTSLRLPSFIVTLATALLFRGVGLALSNGKQVTDLPAGDPIYRTLGENLFGVPTSVWLFVAAIAVLTILFTRTRFGAQVRAIGSNPLAAEFSGLPMTRVRIQALALSGAMAGLAAVVALTFYTSGDPTLGQGYELTAIAAAIIGGTSLAGGRGSVLGAALGCLILEVVASAIGFFSIPINWTSFTTGAVILLAVAVGALIRRIRSG